MNDAERAAWDELVATGHISIDVGIEAASHGAGTNEALVELVGTRTEGSQTALFRQGYLLAQHGVEPTTEEGRAALDLYTQTRARLEGEMDDDEVLIEVGRLLEYDVGVDLYSDDGVGPNEAELAELQTPEGRLLAQQILLARAAEQMGPNGWGGGNLSKFFSDTDDAARASREELIAASYTALLDGEISETELQGQQLLYEQFGEDHAAMVRAQDAITNMVSMGVSLTVATALTIATWGTATPATGAWIAAVTAGSTVTAGEVVGGDRHDVFGEAGATEVAYAGAEVLTLGLGRVWVLARHSDEVVGGAADAGRLGREALEAVDEDARVGLGVLGAARAEHLAGVLPPEQLNALGHLAGSDPFTFNRMMSYIENNFGTDTLRLLGESALLEESTDLVATMAALERAMIDGGLELTGTGVERAGALSSLAASTTELSRVRAGLSEAEQAALDLALLRRSPSNLTTWLSSESYQRLPIERRIQRLQYEAAGRTLFDPSTVVESDRVLFEAIAARLAGTEDGQLRRGVLAEMLAEAQMRGELDEGIELLPNVEAFRPLDTPHTTLEEWIAAGNPTNGVIAHGGRLLQSVREVDLVQAERVGDGLRPTELVQVKSGVEDTPGAAGAQSVAFQGLLEELDSGELIRFFSQGADGSSVDITDLLRFDPEQSIRHTNIGPTDGRTWDSALPYTPDELLQLAAYLHRMGES